jgi:hypothetical protein
MRLAILLLVTVGATFALVWFVVGVNVSDFLDYLQMYWDEYVPAPHGSSAFRYFSGVVAESAGHFARLDLPVVLAPILVVTFSQRNFVGSNELASIALAWNMLAIVSTIAHYAGICQRLGIKDMAAGGVETHGAHECLYFSVVTWTTLGYGDFVPSTELRSYAAEEAFTGYVAIALFLVGLISWVGRDRAKSNELDDQLSIEVKRYLLWVVKGGELEKPSAELLYKFLIFALIVTGGVVVALELAG